MQEIFNYTMLVLYTRLGRGDVLGRSYRTHLSRQFKLKTVLEGFGVITIVTYAIHLLKLGSDKIDMANGYSELKTASGKCQLRLNVLYIAPFPS